MKKSILNFKEELSSLWRRTFLLLKKSILHFFKEEHSLERYSKLKRNELLKKTGICFTAVLLAGTLAAAGPSLAVKAANTSDPNLITDPSLGYTYQEIAEEVSSENQGGESSQEGNSGGETTSSADENSSSGSSTPPTDGSGENDNSGTGGGSQDGSETGSGDTSGTDGSSGEAGTDTGSDGSSGTGTGTDGGSDTSSGSGTETGSGSAGSSEADDTETGSGSGQSSGKESGSGKTDSGQDSGSNTGAGKNSPGQNTGNTGTGSSSSGQNSGQDSSDTDSDVESGSETDYDTDSDSSGQSEEYRRRPFIGDPNNIPYAPGISAPTLIIPDTDPFAGISAPLMDIDPTMPLTVPSNVLVPRPGTPQYTTSSLPNIETILGEGEYPAGYAQAANYTGTNEQLIAAQNIVSGLSLLSDGFRFYTVDKDLAVSPAAQSVYEEMNNTSREVGLLSDNDALYVLNEENNGWLYVESGNVRGFVPAAYVLRGAEAQQAVSALQPSGTDNSVQTGSFTDEDTNLNFAVETIPAGENSAFTYMRCTTKSTVIDKQYAIADQDLPILEEASSAAREIGRLSTGGICYIIQQVDDHWLYVESGNVRGFAPASSLTTGNAAKKIVQQNGEAAMSTAVQLVLPSDNAALYYSLNSTQEGTALNSIRSDIVQTAASCIGCPYKWGGNSLRGGCDCSGFVKQLYALYGYNLPRVADDQSTFGTQIPIADAAPGDLIFFASNGYVYHVALYAGNGTTIEAFSENRGIIATSIGNRDAVWATRIIQD